MAVKRAMAKDAGFGVGVGTAVGASDGNGLGAGDGFMEGVRVGRSSACSVNGVGVGTGDRAEDGAIVGTGVGFREVWATDLGLVCCGGRRWKRRRKQR